MRYKKYLQQVEKYLVGCSQYSKTLCAYGQASPRGQLLSCKQAAWTVDRLHKFKVHTISWTVRYLSTFKFGGKGVSA